MISPTAQAAAVKTSAPEEQRISLQRHLKEVTESEAFKGSNRSIQFLTYIVEQAIAGNLQSLKERVLGTALFGRSPSYDTGQDAIVRVAASDVRKRLLQYYSGSGAASDVHISLPQGSYIPELRWDPAPVAEKVEQHGTGYEPGANPDYPSAPAMAGSEAALVEETAPTLHAPVAPWEWKSKAPASNRRLWLVAPLALLGLALAAGLWLYVARARQAAASLLPWSAILNPAHSIRLITSDPAIVSFQALTGNRMPLMDYENHRYTSQNTTLSPEASRFLQWGDWTAPGDVQIAVNIAELAQRNSRQITVQPAATTRLSDLRSDDNLIFLGSPRSNPWVSLFNEGLDFQFAPVDASQKEVIRNVRPRANEQTVYAPTGTTGETFAIVAFVQNPDRDGQVLLLAGSSGLGTDVAGRLVTDLPRLSSALQSCGIQPAGPLKHFEMLLRVHAMAGSSRGFDVVACHILRDAPTH